jgi:predicted class III extradiol MEMO1 family dioxygenase
LVIDIGLTDPDCENTVSNITVSIENDRRAAASVVKSSSLRHAEKSAEATSRNKKYVEKALKTVLKKVAVIIRKNRLNSIPTTDC